MTDKADAFRAGWVAALEQIQGFAGLSDEERLAMDRAFYDEARKHAQCFAPADEVGRR